MAPREDRSVPHPTMPLREPRNHAESAGCIRCGGANDPPGAPELGWRTHDLPARSAGWCGFDGEPGQMHRIECNRRFRVSFPPVSARGGEWEGKNVGYFTFLMGMTRIPPIMAQTPAM